VLGTQTNTFGTLKVRKNVVPDHLENTWLVQFCTGKSTRSRKSCTVRALPVADCAFCSASKTARFRDFLAREEFDFRSVFDSAFTEFVPIT